MDERKGLAERFEAQRPRLRAVAYRMLGSLSEAEDAVQEAWLRLSGAAYGEVDDLGAWLTTVVARISLNMLRSRKTRSEAHVPEPIIDRADGTSPEHGALLASTVGLALLVVLETLEPAERIAFVLHDVFGMPFEEIAPIVERTPEAARQLASRARRRVQARNASPDADVEVQRSVVDAFRAAAEDGDFQRLVAVLDPEVVLRVGGGRDGRRIDRGPRCGAGGSSSADLLAPRPASGARRSSTAHPGWSACSKESCSRSWPSRSEAGRSPRSTSSATPSGSATSI